MRLDLAAEGSLAADIARLGNRPAPPAPMSELGAALAFNLFVFVAKYVPGLAPLLLERGDWARVYGRIAAKEQARAGGTLPPQLTRWHDPNALLFPGLATRPFHEARDPWWRAELADTVALLERFHPAIRDEALALGQQRLQQYRDHGDALLHENGDWNVHYVRLEGKDTSAQRRQTPTTAAVVDAVARSTGHAFLSVLDPGTHILPHCGPSNYRLRVQLGVSVPDGCRIRVGGETREWREGKCLVLDDAFEHEVWNESDEKRVVLIVDIWHPDFSAAEVAWMEQTRASKQRRSGSGGPVVRS